MKILPIKNCKECPFCVISRTPGTVYANDFNCKRVNKRIKGYVEWPSDEPQDHQFPEFCPLEDDNKSINAFKKYTIFRKDGKYLDQTLLRELNAIPGLVLDNLSTTSSFVYAQATDEAYKRLSKHPLLDLRNG